ncbi:SH3 domain-containing protein [Chytridium lagenaria]|nr:SH3 domain-containing protein [Chytridium lagenaria]
MKFVRGIYDYEGATEEELDFCEGDVMEVVNDDDPDWWYVRIGDEEGYVPTTYIATEEDEDNKEETRDDFSDIHAYESTAEKMESGPKD